MSYLSQFFGLDAQGAQQDAINRQRQEAQSQLYFNRNQLLGTQQQLESAQQAFGTQAGLEAQRLTGLGSFLDEAQEEAAGAYDQYGGAARAEFQGALQDIFKEGRNQAASSGLIGGFQEGQATAPAIAALGRSFATRQEDMFRNIASQKARTALGVAGQKVGLGQQASQLRLSPFAARQQQATQMLPTFAGLAGQAGSALVQTRGNYAEPANPLGNILGAVGGVVGGLGSLFGAFGGGDKKKGKPRGKSDDYNRRNDAINSLNQFGSLNY